MSLINTDYRVDAIVAVESKSCKAIVQLSTRAKEGVTMNSGAN